VIEAVAIGYGPLWRSLFSADQPIWGCSRRVARAEASQTP